jgi:hypothetical protein
MFNTTKIQYKNGVILIDWGKPEYLDGAQMQYHVETKGYEHAAYFSNKEDAEMYAEALSNRRNKVVKKGT